MSNPAPAAINAPQSPLAALGCDDCWIRTGLFTRVLIVIGLLGVILSLIGPVAASLAYCPILVFSNPVHLFRILTSAFVSDGFLSGLFALLTLWQTGVNIEATRGTIWFGGMFAWMTICTNIVLTLIVLLFGVLLDSGFFAGLCAMGLWPAVFGFMTLDCMSDPERPRRICCFPCELPSKYYPLIMLAIFTLVMGGIDGGMWVGLMVGYAMHHQSRLQLSLTRTQRIESHSCLAFLRTCTGFVPASVSGVAGGGGSAWSERDVEAGSVPPPSQPVASARFATVHGPPSAGGPAASAPPAPSVFTGTGHRLGGPMDHDDASNISSSVFALPFSSSSSNTPAPISISGGSSIEARNQRAAAIEQRLGKLSSSSKPLSPKPRTPPSASSYVIAGPPSPSRILTSAVGAADSSVFSLGVDEEDESDYDSIYDVEDRTATVKPSVPAFEASPDEVGADVNLDEQGFMQSRGSGRSGYAHLDALSADDVEMIGLDRPRSSSAGEDGDAEEHDAHANERTALSIQR